VVVSRKALIPLLNPEEFFFSLHNQQMHPVSCLKGGQPPKIEDEVSPAAV
jgi:hypothetical protein